jgi:hypothetical protein
VLDLHYDDYQRGWFGLGMHRGALFELLIEQLRARGVTLCCGRSVKGQKRRGARLMPLGEGCLYQVAAGTTTLVGFLPSGRGPRGGDGTPLVSLFFSVPAAHAEQRTFDLHELKRQVLALAQRAAPLLEQIHEADQVLPTRPAARYAAPRADPRCSSGAQRGH